jgi:hypothetical protein
MMTISRFVGRFIDNALTRRGSLRNLPRLQGVGEYDYVPLVEQTGTGAIDAS